MRWALKIGRRIEKYGRDSISPLTLELYEEDVRRLEKEQKEEAERKERRAILRQEQDARNQRIMYLRAQGWTLKAIGQEMGVTGNRIRQIIERQKDWDKRQRIYDILSSPSDTSLPPQT